jgi:hypothetical protein
MIWVWMSQLMMQGTPYTTMSIDHCTKFWAVEKQYDPHR